MIHRHLDEAITGAFDQRRNEAMHAFEGVSVRTHSRRIALSVQPVSRTPLW